MGRPNSTGLLPDGTCPCCGQKCRPPPPGTFLTYIGNWHRFRLRCANELSEGYGQEIGCGLTPDGAAEEAWEWWWNLVDNLQPFRKNKGRTLTELYINRLGK